jgi:hypothetical protein
MYEDIDDSGREVTVRKDHECEWCDEWIEKGERSVIRKYKMDGAYHSARMHPECRQALQGSVRDNGGFDVYFRPGAQKRGQKLC